jgi:hypothetical protein
MSERCMYGHGEIGRCVRNGDCRCELEREWESIPDIGEQLESAAAADHGLCLSEGQVKRLLSFLECSADYEKMLEMELGQLRGENATTSATPARNETGITNAHTPESKPKP